MAFKHNIFHVIMCRSNVKYAFVKLFIYFAKIFIDKLKITYTYIFQKVE